MELPHYTIHERCRELRARARLLVLVAARRRATAQRALATSQTRRRAGLGP